jgi:hypothetical protein
MANDPYLIPGTATLRNLAGFTEAIDAGWHIDWDTVTAQQNTIASVASFAGDDAAFVALLSPITTPIRLVS